MELVIDSACSFEEAIAGTRAPDEVVRSLALMAVRYLSFDGRVHGGQVVVHRDIAEEVQELFEALLALRFPIAKAIPLAAYDWDDEAAMQDNNTSAFNYRTIATTDRLSNHSFGRALDVNPRFNPYTQYDGKVVPEGASYDPARPGTLVAGSPAVAAFLERNWSWGGAWSPNVDWQHFEKPLP